MPDWSIPRRPRDPGREQKPQAFRDARTTQQVAEISSPSAYSDETHDIDPSDNSALSSPVEQRPQANARRRVLGKTRRRSLDHSGLRLLHEPETTPIADLVFVHSVGGGSQQSWLSEENPETFWPQLWLPKEQTLSATRISTFGYNWKSSVPGADEPFDVTDCAKGLLYELRFKVGREDRPLKIGSYPLIFVAHSLGGLVVKKAYLLGSNNANLDFQNITGAVRAFVFFSTPHRGIDQHGILENVLSACVPDWTSTPSLYHLTKHKHTLHVINVDFKSLAPQVDVVSFLETKSSTDMLTLQKDQATIGYRNEKVIPLNSDHLNICKFTSKRDANYLRVRDILQYLLEKIKPELLNSPSDAFDEELICVSDLLGLSTAPEDDHSFFADKRVEGTCKSILGHEAFEAWLHNDSLALDVLWCYGKPGSGKSVASSHIIEHLKEQQQDCAYYYFRSGDQVKNNLTLFLLSIALQISFFSAEYRRKLCRLADDGFSISKAGYRMLWKRLFVSSLLKVKLKAPVFIVVDGLDELELSLARELLSKMFVELADFRQPLRLLLVSRPVPDIESAMDRLSRHLPKDSTIGRFALDNNEKDLALYVGEEMDSMPGNEAFKRLTIQRVLEKASGNFLWVHLVVREILECNTEDDVESALTTVPEELNPLYLRMDQRLSDTFQHRPNDRQLGQTILTWASCSRYPLLLDELKEALNPEHARIIDMRQTVQKVCGEFVVIDKRSHLSMMHASARDFLLAQSDLNYYIQPGKAHQTLFRKCINKLVASTLSIRQAVTKTRGFIKYAAVSWPFHLNATQGYQDRESLSLLMSFFQSAAVLDWILIIASSGSLRVLVDAAKALTAFLKTVKNDEKDGHPLERYVTGSDIISSWAHDLIRIVGKFGYQITRHPSAIYDLIPAFCPKMSAVHQQFASDISEASLRLRGTTSSTWDDCLAKFSIPGESMPQKVFALDRHFAILTAEGVVRLFYSGTCEEARVFKHGDPVLTMCFNASGDLLATYGLEKTKVWDTRTARHLFTIENPRSTQALAMTFKTEFEHEDMLITFSDDASVRICSLMSASFSWELFGRCIGGTIAHLQTVNAPHNATFAPDGNYVAVTYRGAHPSVWALDDLEPRFVAHCERQSTHGYSTTHSGFTSAIEFSWNPITGHLLGIWNDGSIFKWHPLTNEYHLSDVRGNGIKCSADGNLFVTSSGDCSLRIWDFHELTPIYHLTHPHSIRDIDIDRNEARIYDIRDMYCSVWQPNALLRSMESDDKASDTQSITESISQASFAVHYDSAESVTALLSECFEQTYALGNDGGQALLFNFDGQPILTLFESFMAVEHIACCKDSGIMAVADLGRDVTVKKVERDEHTQNSLTRPLLTLSESDSIQQLLLSNDGTLLLVVTDSALKIYDVSKGDSNPSQVLPEHRRFVWVEFPGEGGLLMGLGAEHLVILPWRNLLDGSTIYYNRRSDTYFSPFLGSDARRPSQAYPLSPSEVDAVPTKVSLSPDHKYLMVELRYVTRQAARRIDNLLIELEKLHQGKSVGHVPVTPVPIELSKDLRFGLGFVTPKLDISHQSRRPSANSNYVTRRLVARQQYGEQIFAFIDQSFWVCSINLCSSDGRPRIIRRHFLLPRDWHNTEWLELATINKDGTFFCPRNGEVAIVCEGLAYEWTED